MIKSIFINNTNRFTSRWIVLVIDLLLITQSFVVSYLIRFNFTFDFDINNFLYQLPLIIIIGLINFLIIGSYKGIVRRTGFKDIYNIFYSLTLICISLVFCVYFNKYFNIFDGYTIPLSIIAIHYLLNIVLLVSSRLVFKFLYLKIVLDLTPKIHVMIYGAGDSGFKTYSVLIKDRFKVVGYIDDNPSKVGRKIDGIFVYSLRSLNTDFINDNKIKEIIISMQNITPVRLLHITDSILKLDITMKIVPEYQKWIGGQLNIGQIKQVKIEDLLERQPINLNNPMIERELQSMKIMITGAAGSIGSEIVRQILKFSFKQLILIDNAESPLFDLQQELISFNESSIDYYIADICDKSRMEQIFTFNKPDVIYHAAAYKHVPLMEKNPYEAIRVNVKGTCVLADLALKNKVSKFIMISTDKAINPTNIMGASKRVAEMYTSILNDMDRTKFITTRFGNVLGSNGSVIPLFKKQLSQGGPLRVTHKDVTRYFMTIPEACQLVLEASVMGQGGETFIFDMGDLIRVYDLARKIIQLSGFRYPQDIDIKITGLRPGEKLFEELLGTNENTSPTYHKKIMILRQSNPNSPELKKEIIQLCKLNNNSNDSFEVVSIIKKIVPEFKSNNSIYEVLDNDKSI